MPITEQSSTPPATLLTLDFVITRLKCQGRLFTVDIDPNSLPLTCARDTLEKLATFKASLRRTVFTYLCENNDFSEYSRREQDRPENGPIMESLGLTDSCVLFIQDGGDLRIVLAETIKKMMEGLGLSADAGSFVQMHM